MSADEYQTLQEKQYHSILDKHEIAIVDWLERFPDMSAAQVQDWLLENYHETFADRTVRNYVNQLRVKHVLPAFPKKL